VAVWQDRIIQLTWQDNTAYVWDRDTFAAEGSFLYPGEGWGLTHDGRRLIMSDGSPLIWTFRDPDTFAVLDTVAVTDDGAPVTNLNELEWIRGEVFANQLEPPSRTDGSNRSQDIRCRDRMDRSRSATRRSQSRPATC
jgi:glutamine cyclotransferase